MSNLVKILSSHDTSSPSSQRILTLLQSRVKPAELTSVDRKNNQVEDAKSPAVEYLQSVSSSLPSQSAPFELEVVDRKRATPDQWNTIGSYLCKNKRSEVEMLKGEKGAILVNWDDGQALQTEDAVQGLLDGLSKHQETQTQGSWWTRWLS